VKLAWHADVGESKKRDRILLSHVFMFFSFAAIRYFFVDLGVVIVVVVCMTFLFLIHIS